MPEINPTRINQPKVDLGQEITADGNPVTQMAAPTHAPRQIASRQEESTTMADAPTVDESGNNVTTEVSQETGDTQTQEGQQTNQEREVQEEVTDFTKFLEAKETGELTDEIHKKKEAETQIQAKPSVETQQTTQKPTIAERKAADLSSRDLTGLPEDLVPHFQKDMSRAAFDKIKPLIVEHKTLKEKSAAAEQELERLRKGAIPDSYYDNPNGFVLDPEYQKAEISVIQAQAVLQHWQNQYKAINDGATDYQLAQFDANGNLVPTQKVVAGKDAMNEVLQIVNAAQQQMFKVAGKAEAIRETFKTRHTNALGWLGNYENKAFAVFNTEQGKQFEPQIKSILSEFPSEYRSHPLAKTLAKSIATNVHLATLLVQMNKGAGNGQQTTQTANGGNKPVPTKVQQQRRAGPTVADVGAAAKAGNNNGGNDEVSMDDFNRAKEESF